MTGLEVIGAGPGRTGTMSLHKALEMLGYDPCMHMKTIMMNHDRTAIDMFYDNELKLRAGKQGDWSYMANFKGAIDYPASCYALELFEAFPNAKVIYTVRDFDAWYESVTSTIYRTKSWGFRPNPLLAFLMSSYDFRYKWHAMVDMAIWERWCGGHFGTDKEAMRALYEEHIRRVKEAVPADQLLLYHVREGWAPLCKFLGKPVPSQPFPNINDTKEFNDRLNPAIRSMRIANITTYVAVAAAVAGAAVLVAKAVKPRS